MNKPILLIDGSTLAFIHGNKEDYKSSIRDHIEHLLNRYRTSYYVIILEDSKTNFRNKVAVSDEYKGHRRTEKALTNMNNYLPYLHNCFEELKLNYRPVIYYNIENDDAIRILAKRLSNVVICTSDSDMYCIEGKHHNLKSNKQMIISNPGIITFDKKKVFGTGYYNTYIKLLKGSQKENYKGLTGYGDKKVYSLLKDATSEKEMQDIAIEHFKLAYGNLYLSKLSEGFRISWIIETNDNLITPEIIDYNDIKLNFQ